MLHFDIDWQDLLRIGEELQASDKQIKFALSRALRRTEASLRKLSSKGLPKVLGLRVATALRKRLRSIKLRATPGSDGVALWYGLNPLPVSSFKGRVQQDDGGAWKKDYYFDDAFVAKSSKKGQNTIFKRKGKDRLPIVEQSITIEDAAFVYIEDEVFEQTLDIFWRHFQRDLKARVKFQIGEQ
ncbi:hypothetical protein ACET8S_04985 [Aeromonas veronii]